ncbi:MAG: 50S ribosomal protein L21 [Oscillospiraceae bacterium]
MYAIIKTGGKQYRVEKGDEIYVEKIVAEAGDTVSFQDVLVVGDEGKVTVGEPFVKGAEVTATVVKNGKGRKINVFTYRPKKGSARRVGHRQPYTKLQITDIKA